MTTELSIEDYADTELGFLPKDWEVKKVSDIADVKYGKSKPIDIGTVPVIGSSGTYGYTSKALIDYPTIVIGRKGNAGTPWLCSEPCYPSDTTFYLVWKRKVNPKYVFAFFSLHPLSGEHAKTTVPSLQKPDLENFLIPLPSLSEQEQISFVLSTIQVARAKTENTINSLKELKKSLMKHLFSYGFVNLKGSEESILKQTEIGLFPRNWDITNLGEVCEVKSGGTPSTSKPEYWTNGNIPWIKSGQCQDCSVNNAQQFITKEGLNNSSAKMLEKNTVLVAMVGATVGKTGFLTIQACSNQNVAGLFPRKDARLDSLYLFYCLQSRYNEFTKTKGFVIANLSFIRNLKVPLPRLDEQREIASILSSIDNQIATEGAGKKALTTLFSSMLSNLMSAKIRVKEVAAL